jgi:hypothetical protein
MVAIPARPRKRGARRIQGPAGGALVARPRRQRSQVLASTAANISVNNGVFLGASMQQAIVWDRAGLLTIADSRFDHATSGLPVIHQGAGDMIVNASAFSGAASGFQDFTSTSAAGRTLFTNNLLYSGAISFGNSQVTQGDNQP